MPHDRQDLTGTVARFVLNCVGSSVPIVGGVLTGVSAAWSDVEETRFKKTLGVWMHLQEEQLLSVHRILADVALRLEQSEIDLQTRIQSREYLGLIEQALRESAAAGSESKRACRVNLLIRAAQPSPLCTDDILHLFLRWLDELSDAHLLLLRILAENPSSSRAQIWSKLHGAEVREDSAEADLFKRLVHDLTLGHLIRQHRAVDETGRFLRSARRDRPPQEHLASAFDTDKPYELTQLGGWFIKYIGRS